jgi:hypothetical protein
MIIGVQRGMYLKFHMKIQHYSIWKQSQNIYVLNLAKGHDFSSIVMKLVSRLERGRINNHSKGQCYS